MKYKNLNVKCKILYILFVKNLLVTEDIVKKVNEVVCERSNITIFELSSDFLQSSRSKSKIG